MPISILIPTHNRPALLPRAVASALAACPPDGEVVVVDDGSHSPAADCLASIGDERLRVLRHESPLGAASARNTGADKARHEVLVFLDDDDEMMPDYIDRLVAQDAFARAEAGFAASLRVSDHTGSEKLARRRAVSGPLPAALSLRRRLFAFSEVPWIRREVFRTIGGIDPAFQTDEDADFCCRLAERGGPLWYEAVASVRR
jgi:glycosyltransferase involved in cell wall biosynthesis